MTTQKTFIECMSGNLVNLIKVDEINALADDTNIEFCLDGASYYKKFKTVKARDAYYAKLKKAICI